MPRVAKPRNVQSDLWAASRGFLTVWVAHLGRRHRLFERLAASKRPLSALQLARAARLGQRPVALWCEAAAALELLTASKGRYRLAPGVGDLLLDETHPSYLGGHLSYLALRSLDFDGFDELFKDGRPSARRQRHLLQAFTEATKWDHTAFEDVLLRKHAALRALLKRGADVLDVGAGAGAWELVAASSFPRSRFVGIEPDRAALQEARSRAGQAGLSGRIHFVPASGETMTFRERFDVVFLGEVLCTARDPEEIIRRAFRALRPGGFIAIAEGLIDEAKPPHAAGNALVLPLRLEFALQPADFFTIGRMRAALRSAGFTAPRFVSAGGGFYFVVAKKQTRPRRRAPLTGGA